MDAENLYQAGVAALRDRGDRAEARRLLGQSLKLDSGSAQVWLWYARALDDPQQQRRCVERALSIDPDHAQARAIFQKLTGQPITNGPTGPAPAQIAQVVALTQKGDDLARNGDDEGAVEHWVRALEIQPDHEPALRGAVRLLARMGYNDDARTLVWRAIDSGTQLPSVYVTAMEFARREQDPAALDDLRQRVVRLPQTPEPLVIKIVDEYLATKRSSEARALLETGLERYPESQGLLLRMGDLQQQLGFPRKAMVHYNRAAHLGLKTPEGREADKKLAQFPPVLTDRERGSLALAWREAAGIGLFFVLLAFQDAGLDVTRMGVERWLGVLLSVVGGYLLVTATSSPQQRPIAQALGGDPPLASAAQIVEDRAGTLQEASQLPTIPAGVRWSLGLMGAALLVAALWLAFGESIRLLFNPVEPNWFALLR